MYGLFLRALQGYVSLTFGSKAWARVLARIGFVGEGFEPLLPYDAAMLDRVLDATVAVLMRSADMVLEDLGTHIVTNPGCTAPRRLLRFGGATYAEFLLSLEELPDRARLALPEVDLPPMLLDEVGPNAFLLSCPLTMPALAHVLIGVLRAMADDYGALVVIEPEVQEISGIALSIRLHEPEFSAGRHFHLTRTEAAHG